MNFLKTFLAACLSLAMTPAQAAVPTLINFQGRIELPKAELEADEDGGDEGGKEKSEPRPFTGMGRFKFAIVNSSGAILWTSMPGNFMAPPPAFVSLLVQDGIFNVALGDPALGMPPVTPALFSEPDRFLRVFFAAELSKGKKTKLTSEREFLPAQRLMTVPFAFASGSAGPAVDRQTVQTLLAGATVQGSFAVAGPLQIGQNTIILGETPATGGAPNTIAFESGDAFIKTQDPAAGSLTLQSGGTQHIIISPGGNLGIGINNPTGLLSFKMGTGSGQAHALGVAHIDVIGGTVGPGVTTEIPLGSYTLPANSLNTTGKAVRIRAWGIRNDPNGLGSGANINVYFGASATLLVHAEGPPLADFTDPWIFEIILARASNGSLKALAYCEHETELFCDHTVTTFSENLASDLQLSITGQPLDPTISVTLEMLIVEYLN